MKMNRAMLFVLLAVVSVMPVALAQKSPPAQDPNMPRSAGASGAVTRAAPGGEDMGGIVDQVMASEAATDPNLCAIVVLPGPAEQLQHPVWGLQRDRRPP